MRCLHVLPMNKLSGAEKLALILCKNMKKYVPIVVCGGENLKLVFEAEGIKSYSVDFANNNILRITNELKKIIKENDVKIIHAHDNNASVSSYLTKVIYRLDTKVISHIHNCYPWLEGNTKTKKVDTFFRKRYDHNIACGKLVYDYYTKNTDYINESNTTTLSNAIDIDEIKTYAPTNIEEVYQEFNIPKDKIILGFIGRLSEQKGIIPFINELRHHKDKFNDCKFLLIGNGEQEYEVKLLLKEYNLEELFILTGYQENVYKFYPIIDIFFLPSIYEGLPMVILEAMSFEKPIVSMNVGSLNEVVEDNYNGILVEQGDLSTFISKLIYIKRDKKHQKKFGLNARETIERKYDINRYNSRIIYLYDEVLNK